MTCWGTCFSFLLCPSGLTPLGAAENICAGLLTPCAVQHTPVISGNISRTRPNVCYTDFLGIPSLIKLTLKINRPRRVRQGGGI